MRRETKSETLELDFTTVSIVYQAGKLKSCKRVTAAR